MSVGEDRKLAVFEEIDLGSSPKEIVRIAICQLSLGQQEMQSPFRELSAVARAATERKVLATLEAVKPFKPDLIVFPEVCIDRSMLDTLHFWGMENGSILVAGTHYVHTRQGIVSRCPILLPDGSRYDTDKFCISPFEKSIFREDSVIAGTQRYIFKNSTIGNFCVLICADYLDEPTTAEVFRNELDVVFVVACQPESQRYHKLMANHCLNSEEGVFIAYCNLKSLNYGDGGSALFGVVHRNFTQALMARQLSDLNPEQKVWQASSPNDFLIAELDICTKRPLIGTSVHDEPNIHIVANRAAIGGRKKVQNTSGRYKLIAFDMDGTLLRGLDFSWSVLWEYCGDSNGTLWRRHLRLYRDRKISYSEWCSIATAYFKKARLTKSLIVDIAKEKTRLTANFERGMSRIRALGLKTVIVSGGIDIFLRAVIPNYEKLFDFVFINKLHFDADDVVSGVEPTAHDFEGKLTAIQEICETHDYDITETIFVGDRFNDDFALSGCGHSIVYSEANDSVSLTCDMRIIDDDFNQLANYIEQICVNE